MFSLDDNDMLMDRPTQSNQRSFSLRPLLTFLVVILLGGGLGGVVYVMSSMRMDDIIALLDVSDSSPFLSLQVPGYTPAPKPAAPAPAQNAAMAPGAVPSPGVLTEPTMPSPRGAGSAPTYATLPVRQVAAKPLPPAPVEDLVRASARGPQPVIARDGRQSWQVYARPFDGPADKPKVAVVITDLGLDKAATEAAITKLPPEVTLAFSPYAGTLDKWVKSAREAGHEVMLGLPVETSGYPARDPGPLGLLTTTSSEETLTRLEKIMGKTSGYVGVWAPDGPFVQSARMGGVLATLRERGLLYVGDGALGEPLLPTAAVNTALGTEIFRDAMDTRLAQASQGARLAGGGLVVASPRPVTYDRLLAWMETLGEQGVQLAPASAVAKRAVK